MGFWKWLWEEQECFVDVQRGIYYAGHGNNRAVRGMFKNFDLEQPTAPQVNQNALKLISFLIDKGKITEEDLLEYKERSRR